MSNQLNVLIISKQFPPIIGGGGSHAFYLASELSLKTRVQVHVLTASTGTKPRQKLMPGKNLFIYRVDFGHTVSLPYEGAIKRGLQLCGSIAPDIIHGQHWAGALIGLHLKASFGIPLVVTIHKTPRLGWGQTITKRDSLYSYMKLLSRLEMIDMFVAGSKAFEQELKSIGVPKKKIRLIRHGIPIEWYKHMAYDNGRVSSVVKSLNLSPHEHLIICPSRLDEKRKELHVFVNACGWLRQQMKDKKFVFLITGTATSREERRCKKKLEDIASTWRIKSRLKFVSFDPEELPALYRLAKACVLPSIKEGLGLVLLEALAVSTPVVGSNTLGINEVIRTNEKHGLLFEVGDHEELGGQLLRLFTEENLVRKLRREGFKRLRTEFSAQRMADNHLSCYDELIKKARRRPGLFPLLVCR